MQLVSKKRQSRFFGTEAGEAPPICRFETGKPIGND